HRISAARARQIPSNLPSAVNLLRCRLRLGAKREATSGKPKPLCDSAFLLTTPAVQPTLLVDKNILFPSPLLPQRKPALSAPAQTDGCHQMTRPRCLMQGRRINHPRGSGCEESFPGSNYNDEEREFLQAIDRYKRTHGRPYPTWREVLNVLRALGWRKQPPTGDAAIPSPSSETKEGEG